MGLKLLFVLGVSFLVLRTFDPNRFSQWDFGDAQTMMAATVSRDEGFLNTFFLWVPQFSSPIGKYLDDPEVRHHAHGTGGDLQFSGLGPKRMYTHWPSWYSVPYGVFAKLGVWNKTFYQIWATLLSLGALLFLYLFLKEVAEKEIAVLATAFYFLTPAFLQYSDSLATMPYDDFFRFAFLWRWSLRHEAKGPWHRIVLPSLCYLGAFLTSLDSFAFIPVAAFVADWFAKRKVYFGDLAILISAGFLAIGIQWSQNASYLGIEGAWRDWKGYFLANGGLDLKTRIVYCLSVFVRAFGLTLVPCAFVFILSWLFTFSLEKGRELRTWLLTLAVAGAAFGAIVSGKAAMDYELRQLTPLAALCFAILALGLEKILSERAASRGVVWRGWYPATFYGILFFVGVGKLYAYDLSRVAKVVDYPAATHIPPYRVELLEKVKRAIPQPKVYFQIGKVLSTKKYVRAGYGQVNPVDEFYAEGPVLTVPDYPSLVEDLSYLWKKAPGSFQPVLLIQNMGSPANATIENLTIHTSEWGLGRSWRSLDIEAYELQFLSSKKAISRNP